MFHKPKENLIESWSGISRSKREKKVTTVLISRRSVLFAGVKNLLQLLEPFLKEQKNRETDTEELSPPSRFLDYF